MAAFVGITIVLGVVVGKATHIVLAGEREAPRRTGSREVLPTPDFDVVDREGRTLALSVRQLDLVASPRALWQAHTPRRIAKALAGALEEPENEDALLAALLPDADDAGEIHVDSRAILLDRAAHRRVELWLRGRDASGSRVGPEVRGMRTVEAGDELWTLTWRPEELLSQEQRAVQGGGDSTLLPLLWTRRIADELARCLWPDTAVGPQDDPKALVAQRGRIWAALMPCAERLVLGDLTAADAGKLLTELEKEGVQLHQLRLSFRHQRRYPVRSDDARNDAFEILGRWRYVDHATALAMACAEMGIPSAAHCPDPLLSNLQRRVGALLDARHPSSGLERLAGGLLTDPAWAFLAAQPAVYRFRRDQPVHRRARHYYFDELPETEPPRVVSTIDAELQAWCQHLLEQTLVESDAALAMAIVVDLSNGDVLAVGGTTPYEVAEFLPTWHVFTPGSTFKVVVMASALEEGVVVPEESFFTHNRSYRIENSGRPPISEAEGQIPAYVTATQALSLSVNAVLAQIGMRMDDRAFYGYLDQLGYGKLPGLGIGVERTMRLTPLPWKKAWTQASVSFGHEVGVNLWQHATGLAAVISGGELRPLRLLREVRRDGMTWDLPETERTRVFSAATCDTVRSMMELGAREGTGRHLGRAVRESGTPLEFGSKTGTAEKVGTEVCLHNELWRNRENLARATEKLPPVSYAEARNRPKPGHKSCYTSSICLFGRVAGDDREVMVLLVVEEPRGKGKYGSQVAGPAAMRLLQEALGITREGERFALEIDEVGFTPSTLEERNLDDLPWAVEVPLAW